MEIRKVLDMKKTYIIGGGTFSPIRNHLSLSAPAFGTTAKHIHALIPDSKLVLTKMADSSSKLVTNKDVENFIENILEDEETGTIILNAALCDYDGQIDDIESGFHSQRLKTKNGEVIMKLKPSDKIIGKIRRKRPDIFLVGFKTTTNETKEDQFLIGLNMMKETKCNLVLANDTVTRNNFIITPEETIYSQTTDRNKVILELVEMIDMRSNLTYNRTDFIEMESVNVESLSLNFQKVLKYVIDNNGYISNNGVGFTPGHFCQKITDNSFVSSQRKANHNKVFEEGMTLVKVLDNDVFKAYGKRKPSVGSRSQWLLLKENPGYDCIIHTHNPLKKGSNIPITPQKPYQCGSLECGLNTLNNMGNFGYNIKAVYLDKHGANILFKSSTDPNEVIEFIKNNIELGIKVK